MATEIDSLEIKIEASAEDANKSIDKLANSIDRIRKNIGIAGKEKGLENINKNAIIMSDSMETVAKQVTNSLQLITEKYKELGKGFVFSGSFDSINKQIDKYSNALEKAKIKKQELELSGRTEGSMYEYAVRDVLKYENIIESLQNQLQEIQNFKPNLDINISGISDAEESVKRVGEEIRTISLPESAFNYNAEAMAAVFGEAASEIQNYSQAVELYGERAGMVLNETPQIELNGAEETQEKLSNVSESFSNVGYSAKNASDIIRNAFAGLVGILGKVGSSIGSLATNIKKGLVSAFSKLTSVSKGSNNSLKSGLTTILKYGFGIRSLYVLFNKLRNAVKEGMNNLVQFSSETNASVSLLNNSINQLKNALASMVAPILNAFAPALNQIIQMCIKAANAVNQLISALTGKSTWVKATGLTDDYASSLDNAGNSAKKAGEKIQKGVRAFDELNVISTNDNEGQTGGGGGATAASNMFETVPIDSSILDFAEKIKEAWENADFTEIGSILGNKLKSALDGINWEPIKETASKIGKSLATLINGFVEVDGLGYSIGKTIGEAINTGIILANSFLDNTHWDSVGKFIGEGLNGIVDTVNWEGIGHFFAQKWNAIFETIGNVATTFKWKNLGNALSKSINTFIKDFKWSENGKSLGKLVTGLFETLDELIKGTDWKSLGGGIITAIGGFFKEIKWGTISSSISSAFIGLLEFLTGAIQAVDWSGLPEYIVESIEDFFTSFDWVGVSSSLGELLGSAVKGAIDLVGSIWDMLKDAWGDISDYFNAYIEDAGGDIIEGLWNGIIDALENVDNWLKDNIFQPIVDGIKKAFGIASPAKEMKPLGEYILLGIIEGFKSKVSEFSSAISNWYNESVKPWFTKEKWQELGENVKNGLSSKWEEFKTWWQGTGLYKWWEDNVKPWFTKEKWQEVSRGIKEGISAKWNEFSNWWNSTGIKKWWDEKVKPWFTTDKWKNMALGMKNGLSSKWNEFSSWWQTSGIKKWWDEKVKPWFEKDKWTFDSIKQGLEETFNNAVNAVKTIWNGLINFFKSNPINATANVNGNTSTTTTTTPQYATGGFPKMGELFVAREAGPEMVGTIGGKTAVANNDQITSAISSAVYNAVVSAMANSNYGANVTFKVEGDPNGLFNVVKDKAEEYTNRTGNPAFI